jgi:polysaccharide biosynthesis transport protein
LAATAYGLVGDKTAASHTAPGTLVGTPVPPYGGTGGVGGGGGPSRGDAATPFLPDPGTLWVVFRRRLWLFLAFVATVLALVAAFTLSRPELYSATASILIEPRQPEVLESNPVSPDLAGDTNVIDTEVEILSSRRLAGRVADALKLETWPQFAGAEIPPTAVDAPGTHPLAEAVLSRMDIRRSGLTYLIDIKAEAESPELAAALANEYARQYLDQQQSRKTGVSLEAQEFLETRLVELRRNVAEADAALQSYMIRNGLMSADGATMAEQEVSVLNQEISAARAALAEKEGQLAAARNRVGRGGGGAEVPAALQSGTVVQLRNREAQLTGEVARMEARFGDEHPELLRARGELVDIRSQIQQQIDRVMSSLESDVQAARSRLVSLEGSQRRAQGSLAINNAAQTGFLQLERDAQAARQIYEAFLRRAQDVEAQVGLIRPDASIESFARVPRMPSSPSYPLAIVGGLTLALIFGFMAIAGAEYLDARIGTRTDVERRLGLSYAGAVPELRSTVKRSVKGELPYDYMLEHPQSKFTESIRALKNTLLLGQGTTAIGRSIAITSALPREGKSTTAICLARMLADSGVRTVLVDCDSRRRAVSAAFLPQDWDGFGQYLRRETPLARALFVDERTGLHVLGSMQADLDGRELFSNVSLSEMLDELALRFEAVVLDTAPVLGVAETRLITAGVGQVLMLGRWRSTPIKAVETAADLLLAADANLTGVALTRVDVRKYSSTGQQDIYSYQDKFVGYYVD